MNEDTPLLITCYTQCPNPLCEDHGLDREVVVDVDSWWCWCGSRMQPPACAAPELLDTWVTDTGLDIEPFGNCTGQYHTPELLVTVQPFTEDN